MVHEIFTTSRGRRSWKFLIICSFLLGFLWILTFGKFGFTSSQDFAMIPNSIPIQQLPPPPEVIKDFKPAASHSMDTLSNVPLCPPNSDALSEMSLVQEKFETFGQADPKLIGYVRARYITPPPPRSKPYKLKDPNSSHHKSAFGNWIRKLYKDKREGVFLEAGANNGEDVSHTLDLEMNLGWSGILVECNPKVVSELRNMGRKAWLATVCLSTSGHPQVFDMSIPLSWSYSARLGPSWDLSKSGRISNWTSMEVEAVPLYTVLAAVGLKEIDYFNFDIEGAELAVLRSFPFDQIVIKVLILEIFFYTKEEREELNQLLLRNGLFLVKEIEYDEIYVHESVLREHRVTLKEVSKI